MIHFDESWQIMIDRAALLACHSHAGGRTKTGEAYITHVFRVMLSVPHDNPAARVVALLHDVVEDTQTSLATIRLRFSADIADAVDAISKRKGEKLEDYMARVCSNDLARTVKRIDALDNFGRVKELPDEKQIHSHKKYMKIIAQIDQYEKNLRLLEDTKGAIVV